LFNIFPDNSINNSSDAGVLNVGHDSPMFRDIDYSRSAAVRPLPYSFALKGPGGTSGNSAYRCRL